MFTRKFITIFHSVQEIGPFLPFQNLALSKASTDDKCLLQFLGLDLFNIKLSAQFYQHIPNSWRVKFHFYQNLNLGKTSTNPKCHLTISWATSCQYQCVCKISFNIPLSSRDRAIFTFSEFGARQYRDRWKMTFHNLLVYILSISMFTQKAIKIFHSVQEIRPFSLFQNLALGKASTDDKCHFAIVSLFSEYEPWQKLNQSEMSFDNLKGYALSISTYIQNFITIFHSVQEIAPLSLFSRFFRIWSSTM